MDFFNRDRLQQLAQTQTDCCVSLYMPTFRFESDQEQNPIRYKNLLKDVRQQLLASGMRQDKLDEFLEPAEALFDNTPFWRTPSDGLAVFITEDDFSYYRLPITFEEVAVTGTRFHLKPLFPLIASNNRFYLLALSQNKVKLYQGTHAALSEIKASEIPESILKALIHDDPEKQLQHHVSNRAGRRHDASFHGQGGEEDKASKPQVELKRFFDQVDNGLRETLQDEQAPLVLAGVSYYLPIYRDANKYPNLIEDDIIAGNPENLHPKELHARAWEVVEPLFLESQADSIEKFNQQYHNQDGLASTSLNEIVPASYFSRVDTLFVPIGLHQWGKYDQESNSVELHDEQQPGDEDLLNLATVSTYLNGGTVHALQPENMPVSGFLAATFRYPANVSAEEA